MEFKEPLAPLSEDMSAGNESLNAQGAKMEDATEQVSTVGLESELEVNIVSECTSTVSLKNDVANEEIADQPITENNVVPVDVAIQEVSIVELSEEEPLEGATQEETTFVQDLSNPTPEATLSNTDSEAAFDSTLVFGSPLNETEDEEEQDAMQLEALETDSLPNEKYGNLNRLELVLALEEVVKHEDFQYIRSQIGFIRAAFKKLTKDESLEIVENSLKQQDEELIENEEIVVSDPLVKRFEQALNIYKARKNHFDQLLEKQKYDNLLEKKRIIDELRSLIDSDEELKKTYDKFRDLREKWSNLGPVPQAEKNELWNNFHFLVERFFDKIKINKELKDLDLKRNLEQKAALCEKAEELLLETSIVKTFQKLQKLHEAWREIGPVATDKKDEIWDRFRAATEKLNRRRQEFYDVIRKDQSQNLEEKVKLCEKAELLAATNPTTIKDWQKLTDQINELFEAWKKIGFAPKKINNDVWIRFRAALDTVFKGRREFYLKLKENQTENYNKKLNLCLQAEALKDSTDWRSTTNELIALQNEWKKIGSVPNKFSDKIWKKFRSACDEFFKRKAQFFNNIDETQEENLKKKREIIDQLKNHAYTSNNSENLKIINEYQRQFLDAGHVPIKFKDKIYTEFRKTIDDLFERLSISKNIKSTNSYKAKVENLKSAPNADQAIYWERTNILKKISELQHEVKVLENNIGYLASSKKADLLKISIEEKIEKTRQEVLILEEKLRMLRD